jgi:putative membrane protein
LGAAVLIRLLLRWFLLASVIGLTAGLLPGVHIDGGVGSLLWIAALFGVINLIVGTILKILTIPLIVVTLGLFALVINAVMFELTAHWSSALSVDDFGWALLAALCISTFSLLLELALWRLRRPWRRVVPADPG